MEARPFLKANTWSFVIMEIDAFIQVKFFAILVLIVYIVGKKGGGYG